jgi:transcription elongation factor GreA
VPEETWLTEDAFARLSAELQTLQTTGRAEVVKRIEEARAEGDLKENGGYHAAREEQAKMEGRISHLKALLENARVGETPPADGVVEPGMVVKAKVGGKAMTFLLGSREGAVASDLSVFSERSPLGAAIIGARSGETRTYDTPTGKQVQVEVLDATPYVP